VAITAFKKDKQPDSLYMTTINVSRYYWPEFQKIVKTEGIKSVSLKLRNFVQAYVEEHKAPNPQLRMSYYVHPKEQQPMKVQCDYIRGALSNGQVFCRRKGMWIPGVTCYSCEKNWMRRKKCVKV